MTAPHYRNALLRLVFWLALPVVSALSGCAGMMPEDSRAAAAC